MIKFFRKIRQNLIMENKTGKYLKYAIGEIILVVIGILIALQINNWNETRKIRASETEILQNLKVELISNKNKLKEIIEIHRRGHDNGLYMLNLFGKDVSQIPHQKLDSMLISVESANTFEANDGYIKSLIASSKIDHLQNAELKSFIASFGSMVEDATQEVGYVFDLLNNHFYPVTDGKLSVLNRWSIYYTDFPKGSYTSDYEWFFNNRKLEDLMAGVVSWKKEIITDKEIFSDKIDRMLQLIQNELQSKD